MDKVSKGPLTLNCTCGTTPLTQPCDKCKDEIAKYFNLPFTASGAITPRRGYTVSQSGKYTLSSPFGTTTVELPEGFVVDQWKLETHPFAKEYTGTFIDAAPKCECGSDNVGSPRHSTWCPKFKTDQ